MLALLNFGKLALSFWREILIVVLFGTCYLLKSDNYLKAQKITHLESILEECEHNRNDMKLKLDLIEREIRLATEAHNEAETKRLQIITDFTKQVNNIKKQTPPTECKDAVSWSITNKGDLSWKK